ncbi:CMP-N-acetylneuraminate-beta-galactosamide-alpha-2,3-sialyltransferase 1-like [Asterias amurensis]|uniref:CMP-N-acetylneuraminate-beta-galactosamide- alpha-2,3-sialyltransferase 1-like n=1 Tax=Asterias amurensis TaxID=7602 RepID=UPI003AB13189
MRKAHVLVSTLCRLLKTGIRSLTWRKVSILATFTILAFIAVTLMQRYFAATKLSNLLERDFIERPTRSGVSLVDNQRITNGIDSTNFQQSVPGRIDYFEPSICPRSIASLPAHSRWFRERFKPNVKMFLDVNDIANLDNSSFYDLPFGLKNENLTLLKDILRHPKFKNPSVSSLRAGKDCLSCAVVGSGGILNGSHAGREIDSHDLVFRLNKAVTYGKHADNVGQKTNVYIFFPQSAHLQTLKTTNVSLLYAMFNSFDLTYAAEMFGIGKRNHKLRADPTKLKIIHPNFFRYVFAKYLDGKSMKPTTGAVAVMLALHLCDSVTIYGFGYDPRYTMHYYDTRFIKRSYKSTWTHDVENEKRLWDKLHDDGAIRFFKRDT